MHGQSRGAGREYDLSNHGPSLKSARWQCVCQTQGCSGENDRNTSRDLMSSRLNGRRSSRAQQASELNRVCSISGVISEEQRQFERHRQPFRKDYYQPKFSSQKGATKKAEMGDGEGARRDFCLCTVVGVDTTPKHRQIDTRDT